MQVFFAIAYFVIGLVQFFAVWDGVELFLNADSFIGRMFSFFVSMFLTYVPLVGSCVGVYGAINVWDWPFTKAFILFFWYIPLLLIFGGFSLVSALFVRNK